MSVIVFKIRRLCRRYRNRCRCSVGVSLALFAVVCILYFASHGFKVFQQPDRRHIMEFRRERYLQNKARPRRDGPGENGKAVQLSPTEQKEADRLFKKEAFNIVASDKIAMDRSIPDTRLPG